jgi:hypothetical protein
MKLLLLSALKKHIVRNGVMVAIHVDVEMKTL